MDAGPPPREVLIIEHIVPRSELPRNSTWTMRYRIGDKLYCAVWLDTETVTVQSPESLAHMEWEIYGNCLGHGGDNE